MSESKDYHWGKPINLSDLNLPEVIQWIPYRVLEIQKRWSELGNLASSNYQPLQKVQKILDEIRPQDEINTQHNIAAFKNNRTIFDGIEAMMLAMGAGKEEWDYQLPYQSRKYAKQKKFEAVWFKGIWRVYNQLSFLLGFGWAIRSLEKMEEFYAHYPNEIAKRQEKEDAEREKQKKEAERESLIRQQEQERLNALAKLSVKYGTDFDTYEIIRAITKRSKYLALAFVMEKARGTFSEGEWVDDELQSFSIESPLDQEIYDDVMSAYESWSDHGDGRAFRDTSWSYDRLVEYVNSINPELVEDYRIAYKYYIQEEY